jgi:hypothetical protein
MQTLCAKQEYLINLCTQSAIDVDQTARSVQALEFKPRQKDET